MEMEVSEQIKVFKGFIEANYEPQLLEMVRKGGNFLVLDFKELSGFSPELADELLETPEEVLKAGELAVKEFDLPRTVERFYLRFQNLPESQKILINEIRSKHLGKLLWTEGVVRRKSDVRPHVLAAKFECPSCGNILNVVQQENKYREPSRCSCGRKGKFKELSKELVDGQGLVLEEAPEDLDGGQPKRMDVFLKNDLVSPITEKKTSPGSRVRVVGWVTEVPINLKSGGRSVKFDLIIEANFVEAVHEDFDSLEISEEEREEIMEMSKDPQIYNRLIKSLAPSIYGYEKVKEALMLQLVGGLKKERADGVTTRGDMHVLLIGDPGAAKCVPEDIKIPCADGSIKTMGEIKEVTEINCIDADGKVISQKPAKNWKRESPKRILQIETQSGKEIKLTKEHPLFTTQSGFIFAKPAEEFKVGDFIATNRRIDYQGKIQKLPASFRLSKANNQQRLAFPKTLDKDLARLLGYLIGDRYMARSSASGVVSFTNNNPELIKDCAELIKKLFNGKTTIREKRGAQECYINSLSLINFFGSLGGGIVTTSANKKIPQLINKSPPPILREFIAALFECEARINLKRKQVEICSISKELIEDLQTNLLKFGVLSILRRTASFATNTAKKRGIPAFKLVLSGKSAEEYIKKIGFVSQKKKKIGRSLLDSKIKIKNNTNVDIIPHLKEILKIVRTRYGLHQKEMGLPRGTYLHYELGNRNPSRENLQKIVLGIKKTNKKDLLFQLIEKIANADIFWDKIKEIREIKRESKYVYDLQINNYHNFIANNLIIHNSQLLKRITKIAPKGRYVSGKGVTGAGLTASVVKDEFLGGWSLEAGALVLANRGFCCIDEMDKMGKEDRAAMHEGLEQQSVSISKANIQATLRCETTVLAAANPKFGRFDPYGLVADQINLPPTLINRFDLIFPIKDLPSREKDEKLAAHILGLHQNPDSITSDIDTDLLKKYITFVRTKARPILTDQAIDEIKEYYISMRNSGGDEGGIRSIPITARQLEALVRMAEASAKIRMAEEVTKDDAKKSIEMINYCLSQVAKDMETGKIDIDRISSGIPAKERNKISIIRELIDNLEGEFGKVFPINSLMEKAEERNIKTEEVEEIIEKLRRSGDVYEPRRGFLSKM